MFKKNSLIIALIALIILSGNLFSQTEQKIEVLYFKANLACCKAKACNTLQSEVETVLKNLTSFKNIEFKVIPLADEANKELVEKYNAKSQTVVIIKKDGDKETSKDISDIVRDYSIGKNKERFEELVKSKIEEVVAK